MMGRRAELESAGTGRGFPHRPLLPRAPGGRAGHAGLAGLRWAGQPLLGWFQVGRLFYVPSRLASGAAQSALGPHALG